MNEPPPFTRHNIEGLVEETLTKYGIGRGRTLPQCSTCHVPMRHITADLYQCPKCSKVESL